MSASQEIPVPRYVSSVYYAEIAVRCELEKAWKILVDYQAWNPTFIGAQVLPVAGQFRSEGEIVLIHKSLNDVKGEPLPDFYAETVRLVPQEHICWCVYPKEGDDFRNFVDFGLRRTQDGVMFNIYYYEQSHLSGDLLAKQRANSQASFDMLTRAFKQYCEAR